MLLQNKKGYFWYDKEITETQYNEILVMLRNRPIAPVGYGYRLTEHLEWELYEMPQEEPTDEEATSEDYEAALAEMGVDV